MLRNWPQLSTRQYTTHEEQSKGVVLNPFILTNPTLNKSWKAFLPKKIKVEKPNEEQSKGVLADPFILTNPTQ